MPLKLQALAVALSIVIPTGFASLTMPVQAQQKTKFICSRSFVGEQNFWTTVSITGGVKRSLIIWDPTKFPGYPVQKRCQEVSPRFQQAYDNDTLKLLTNGQVNGRPVICAVEKYGDSCNVRNWLMTLHLSEDSFRLLNKLKAILDGRQQGPIKHSSGTTQAYYQIDIESLLRP